MTANEKLEKTVKEQHNRAYEDYRRYREKRRQLKATRVHAHPPRLAGGGWLTARMCALSCGGVNAPPPRQATAQQRLARAPAAEQTRRTSTDGEPRVGQACKV